MTGNPIQSYMSMKQNNKKKDGIKERISVKVVEPKPKIPQIRRKSVAKNPTGKDSSTGLSSPYLQSLLDPFNYKGSRIPDDVTTPSYALTVEQRISIPGNTNATGTFGQFTAIAVQVGSVGNSASGDYWISTTDSAGALNWVPGTYASVTGTPVNLTTVASQIRPVASGLALTFQGSTNNDQGRMIAAFLPSGFTVIGVSGQPTLPANINSVLIAPYAVSLPAAKRYVSVRYCPTDAIARTYSAPGQTPVRPRQNGSLVTSLAQYGVLIVVIDGMTGTPTCEARLCTNFECLPLNNTTSFQATEPSWTNPMELAAVSNRIASDRNFNVDQSWYNTAAGVATMYTSAQTVSTTKHRNGGIPGMGRGSNSILGDVGSNLGRVGGEALGAIFSGMAL